MPQYQTVVLSGGGAKGPYGLGTLLALRRLHAARGRSITPIYCGSSIGALNATMAAQGNLADLESLYGRLTTRDVLGTSKSRVSYWHMLRCLRRKPFYYFSNDALQRLIEENAQFELLSDNSHLVVCATNYTTGQLETYYKSRLIDSFLAADREQAAENQRLVNYHRIESQEQLVQALLASTAIPFYLPPVRIGQFLYVDGGVGNNTPLRQAAYICRYLSRDEESRLEPTICVINDPLRFRTDPQDPVDIFGVIRRTMDIFHNSLVSDSRMSWDRINKEVKNAQDKQSLLHSDIGALQGIPEGTRTSLARRADEVLQPTDASTQRRELPIFDVRPSDRLLTDILSFNPIESRRLIKCGFADCLRVLENRNLVTATEHRRWVDELA